MATDYSNQDQESRAEAAPTPIKKGREMTGLSQEAMAEVLGVDVRTLRRYESGALPTPDAILVELAQRVKSPILVHEHYKTKYHIADEIMPSVEEMELSQAVVFLLNALAELERNQVATKLLAMSADGMIDLTEEPHYTFVLSKLDGVRRAVDQLHYCDTKGGK